MQNLRNRGVDTAQMLLKLSRLLHFLKNDPKWAFDPVHTYGAAVVLGSPYIGTAAVAANFIHNNGLGEMPVVFTGWAGRDAGPEPTGSDRFDRSVEKLGINSEAKRFRVAAEQLGLNSEKSIEEPFATNTGENAANSVAILQQSGHNIDSLLVFCKQEHARRVWATFMKQTPQVRNVSIVTADVDVENTIRYESRQDSDGLASMDNIVVAILGEVRRLRLYPDMDLIVEQPVPADLQTDFHNLSLYFPQVFKPDIRMLVELVLGSETAVDDVTNAVIERACQRTTDLRNHHGVERIQNQHDDGIFGHWASAFGSWAANTFGPWAAALQSATGLDWTCAVNSLDDHDRTHVGRALVQHHDSGLVDHGLIAEAEPAFRRLAELMGPSNDEETPARATEHRAQIRESGGAHDVAADTPDESGRRKSDADTREEPVHWTSPTPNPAPADGDDEVEAEIHTLELALGIETDAERTLELMLYMEDKFRDVAIAAGQDRPELLFGRKEWLSWLDARSYARNNLDGALTVPFIRELHRRLGWRMDPESAGKFFHGSNTNWGSLSWPLNDYEQAALDENPLLTYVPGPIDFGEYGFVTYPAVAGQPGARQLEVLQTPLTEAEIDAIRADPLRGYKSAPHPGQRYGIILYPNFGSLEGVEADVQTMCDWFNAASHDVHSSPFQVASDLERWSVSGHHGKGDYHGRLSRILLNWALEKAGKPPSAIPEFDDDLLTLRQDWVETVRTGSLRYQLCKAEVEQSAGEVTPVSLLGLDRAQQRYQQMGGRRSPFVAGELHDAEACRQLLATLRADGPLPSSDAQVRAIIERAVRGKRGGEAHGK